MLQRTTALLCATALAAALSFLPSEVEACTCGGPDYAKSFESSVYVFKGKVRAWDKPIAQFDVEGYFKGSGPAQVGIRGTGGGMCQREFEVGATYLVFTEKDLAVGFCDATFMIQGEDDDFGRSPQELAEIMKKLELEEPTAPTPGEALKPPPYKPSAEEKFMQEGWKDSEPEAKPEPEPAEAPTKAPEPPKAKADAETKADAKAATGCMGQVAPDAPPTSLLLFALAALTRRRRVAQAPPPPRSP